MAFKIVDILKLICNYLDNNSLLALSSVNSETRLLIKIYFQDIFQFKGNILLPSHCRNCYQDILFKPKYIRYTIAYCSKECFIKFENTKNDVIALKSKFQKLFIIRDNYDSLSLGGGCKCRKCTVFTEFNIGVDI